MRCAACRVAKLVAGAVDVLQLVAEGEHGGVNCAHQKRHESKGGSANNVQPQLSCAGSTIDIDWWKIIVEAASAGDANDNECNDDQNWLRDLSEQLYRSIVVGVLGRCGASLNDWN